MTSGTNKHDPRLHHLTKHTGRPMDTIMILSVSVLAFIVALAWRDTTTQAFEEYYPDDATQLRAQLIYAVGVTVFTVIVIYLISRIK